MASPDIKSTLKFTRALMLNAFNEARKDSPFEGFVLTKTEASGIYKFGVTFLPAIYKEFTGEAQPVGIDAKNLTVETVKYKNPVEIDKKQLDNTKALVGDEEFMRPIRMRAMDAAHAVDAKIAALIEANSNDVLGSGYFGSGTAIPNSDQTITNTRTGSDVSTVAAIHDDWKAILAAMASQKNAGGRSYHGTSMFRAKPVIWCHVNTAGIMMDAFEKKTLASGEDNRYFGAAEVRPVADFTDTDDWFVANRQFRYWPFLMVQDGPPDEKTNFNGETGDRELLLRDKVLFNSDYSFDVAFGSRFEVFRQAT